ncbi:MAG: M48 family metallopeptidase [Acidobacteria bacterium]|nr:M48 family metallopeptidase [Acidobacteriota bacterium]
MFRNIIILSSFTLLLLLVPVGCDSSRRESTTTGSTPASRFKPGFNLFSPEQDVQLGLQSAQQIMKETPMLEDRQISDYVQQLGKKLAAHASGEKFPYQFRVVATREINAFALPGGFLFVNAGTIAAAQNEGELAGVMAHEISHAALRHGTNQASKQQLAQMGLGILGTIAASGENPNMGEAIGAIGGLGANMLFLKFGRGAEKEADLEGARIMAAAGYDPSDMANFFKTLESKGGQRVPEMLSDHPDPGNRYQYIIDEIPRLAVKDNHLHSTPEFEQSKARLTGQTSALSSQSQLNRIGQDPSDLELRVRPEKPSRTMKGFQAVDRSFSLRIPANWEGSGDSSNIIFSPRGAHGKLKDSIMVTHGIFAGAVRMPQSDLGSATEAFIQKQIETNADFRVLRPPQRVNINGQDGYSATVAGPSAINGVMEVDVTYTIPMADGRMFYLISIAPEDEAESYKEAFQQILRSLKMAR